MRSLGALLMATAIIFFTLWMEQFASAYKYGDDVDGDQLSDLLSFNKKWSRLEPSIRFFKRTPPRLSPIE
ncbi:hypothetical protein GCK32_019420 [Trichostrongylus colubriformis]|uniref:Uncharacterized protein n=1 Tax=Trichostrongylus colubriformis TaxID=6319 RepID=A0AAN8IIS0_TRICO